jgi:hypothetical protein
MQSFGKTDFELCADQLNGERVCASLKKSWVRTGQQGVHQLHFVVDGEVVHFALRRSANTVTKVSFGSMYLGGWLV